MSGRMVRVTFECEWDDASASDRYAGFVRLDDAHGRQVSVGLPAKATIEVLTAFCRCEYRPGVKCLNPSDNPDGMCSPCRRDGGNGHPLREDACRCLVTTHGEMAYVWSSAGCPLHGDPDEENS